MTAFDKDLAASRPRTATIETACGTLTVRMPTMAEFRAFCHNLSRAKTPEEEAANDLQFIAVCAQTPEGGRVFADGAEADKLLTPEEVIEAAKAIRGLMSGPDPMRTR